MTTPDLTVESCLHELQDLFGDKNTLIQRNDTLAFANPALNNWVIIFRYEQSVQQKIGQGSTLAEAMAQARSLAQRTKEQQS